MDYYYDILLNFQDSFYMFYEWDENDAVEYIKKIPIIHVDSKTMHHLLFDIVKVSPEFLKTILDKTKLKQNNTLKYASIFSDGKNNIALEFNDEGKVIGKSSIFLDDEISINEFMYNISVTKLDYEVIKKDKVLKDTRQELSVKKLIKTEIESIYKNKNYSKLKYIYLEWFNELNDNTLEMKSKMIHKLDGNLTKREYHIYDLIKMSYNNV